MMKRTVALIAAAWMMFCAWHAAWAEEAPQFTVEYGILRGYSGPSDVVIPEVVDGQTIVEIGTKAFQDSNITSVVIPGTVEYIGYYAFDGCAQLAEVHLSEGLMDIGWYAFSETALTEIVIPDSVQNIDNYAFYGCSRLSNVEMPENLTSIPDGMFWNCTALEQIELKGNVTKIGSYAFYKCAALESVSAEEGIKEIADHAFYNCTALKSVDFQEGLTSIGSNAFQKCGKLESIALPESLESIGQNAFSGCTGLRRIRIPENVTQIGKGAFEGSVILDVGSNQYAREYAITYGYEYVSDTDSATSEGIDTVEEKVEWIVDHYVTDDMSEYERALVLYDWLCLHVAYDYDYLETDIPTSPHGVTAAGALLGGMAVCQGYADSYEMLLEEAGIRAEVVSGYSRHSNEGHAWNVAVIDGEWYQFDPTWDESGNGTEHDYFGLTDNAMEADHCREDMLNIQCNSWEANYKYRNGVYDASLETLRDGIEESIAAGVYEASVDVSGSWDEVEAAMLMDIIEMGTDWSVDGWADLTMEDSNTFSFVFHPDDVLIKEIHLQGVEEVYDYFYMYPGYAVQLVPVTDPAGAAVSYSSTDESIVSVTEDGQVTAVSTGDASVLIAAGDCVYRLEIWVRNLDDLYFWMSSNTDILDIGETMRAEFYTDHHLRMLMGEPVVFTSDDESVATVDENGIITGVGYGYTTIRASWMGKTDSVEVMVYAEDMLASSMTLQGIDSSVSRYYVYPGYTAQLLPVTEPAGVPVEYSSDDESVVMVSADGVVTGVATGTAEITVRARNQVRRLYIYVRPEYYFSLDVDYTEEHDGIFDIGETAALCNTDSYSNSLLMSEPIVFTSDDESVATVDENGIITGVGYGNTTIRASWMGKTDSVGVAVYAEDMLVSSLTLQGVENNKAYYAYPVYTAQLLPVTVPADVPVEYSSSNESVATVDENGLVTVAATGTAQITVRARNAEFSLWLYVYSKSSFGFSIGYPDTYEGNLGIGETVQAEVSGEYIGRMLMDPGLAWTSDDESIASVDQNGVIMGVGYGETAIRARHMTGEEHSLKVTVYEDDMLVTSLTLQGVENNKAYYAYPGYTAQLLPVTVPADVPVEYSSSNESVATVDENGLVTVAATGTAQITVRARNQEMRFYVYGRPQSYFSLDVDYTEKHDGVFGIGETAVLCNKSSFSNALLMGEPIVFTSDDERIATVDENGVVTGVSYGQTTIRASWMGKTDSVGVMVYAEDMLVSSLTLQGAQVNSSYYIYPGYTAQLLPVTVPADAPVEFSSSDESVVTIDENGVVTGIEDGSAQITIRARNLETKLYITVRPLYYFQLSIGYKNEHSGVLDIGETAELGNTSGYSNMLLMSEPIVWTSDDESVATVDENGVVTGISYGYTTIRASWLGVEDSIEAAVYPEEMRVSSLTLENIDEDQAYYMYPGYAAQLIPVVEPAGIPMEYSSSDESVATVDENGVVTGAGYGSAWITARANNRTVKFYVNVYSKANYRIRISLPEGFDSRMDIGQTAQLEASGYYLHEMLMDPGVTWVSDDESVATVDQNGLVTTVGYGRTTIHAQWLDGVSDSVDIEVYSDDMLVSSIRIEGVEEPDGYNRMYPGYSVQLIPVTEPAGVDVVFESTDETVAAVTEDGWLTAVSEGYAEIILTANNCTYALSINVEPIDWFWFELYGFEGNSRGIDVGETAQVDYYQTGLILKRDKLQWSSDDESIAVVDENGLVTAVGYGKTVIRAQWLGETDSVDIIVRKPVRSVQLEAEVLDIMPPYQEMTIMAEIDSDQPAAYYENYGGWLWWSLGNQAVLQDTGRQMQKVWMGGYFAENHKEFVPLEPGVSLVTATASDGSGASDTALVYVHGETILRLPKALKEIGEEAFMGNTVEEFILPDGAKTIGSRAFADCVNLKLIHLPGSLTEIADDAFEGCEDVKAIVKSGSYAEQYVIRQGMRYDILPQ